MTRLEKILNNLPADTIKDMQNCTATELKGLVVASEQAIVESKEQLDANPAYTEAKENVKACSAAYRELKKYQTAKIQYALILLSEGAED